MKKPVYLQITVIVLTGLLLFIACLPFLNGAASPLIWDPLNSGLIFVVSFQLTLRLVLLAILSQLETKLPEILFYSRHAYRGPPPKTA